MLRFIQRFRTPDRVAGQVGAPSMSSRNTGDVTLDRYFDLLRAAHGGALPLNSGQQQAIGHNFNTPLWIIAGPGTGKTHTLVWLVFKRILVDGIDPTRVILTTFTRKAAAELESRLVLNRQKLVDVGCGEAAAVDVTRVHVGTLHSLCSQLLQDQRYEPTLRIRVLEDELVQQFFVRRSRNSLISCDDRTFWERFGMVHSWQRFAPNTAERTAGASVIFNRMTENQIHLDKLAASGDPHFALLAQAYREYEEALVEQHRTDQAHLQRHFLDFLATPGGRTWLDDGFTVVVDEYQDTNPIQEEIYFKLAGRNADFTVVGDDDQSLYRFRGATVESLIDFDRTCQAYLGKIPAPVHLHENRRSHRTIVDWVNRFIAYHPDMRDATVRVRAPGKPLLDAKAEIPGKYPAVMAIVEGTHSAAASKLATLVRELKDDGLVTNYAQIAMLAFSTRETSQSIGAYIGALRNAGVPVYNPRNRTAHKDARVQAILGALCSILEPDYDAQSFDRKLPRGVPEYLQEARQAYESLVASGQYSGLAAYVAMSVDSIRHARADASAARRYLTRIGGRRVTINGLLYKLLAHEPFATDLTDIEGGERLKALNQILAEYESLYDDGELQIEPDPAQPETMRIAHWTLYDFYSVFIEGIHDGLNDPEDDEISIQPGMVNVMTIHQAKGLEFEVVFVLRPDRQPFVGTTHILEDLLDPFIDRPTKPVRRAQDMRAAEDAVRLFFVAYSRAKRLLVLTGGTLAAGGKIKGWNRVLGRDVDGNPLDEVASLVASGVCRL